MVKILSLQGYVFHQVLPVNLWAKNYVLQYLQEEQLITMELQPFLGTQRVEEVQGLAGAGHHEVIGGRCLQRDLRGHRGRVLRHRLSFHQLFPIALFCNIVRKSRKTLSQRRSADWGVEAIQGRLCFAKTSILQGVEGKWNWHLNKSNIDYDIICTQIDSTGLIRIVNITPHHENISS